jgi:hypothetical protein
MNNNNWRLQISKFDKLKDAAKQLGHPIVVSVQQPHVINMNNDIIIPTFPTKLTPKHFKHLKKGKVYKLRLAKELSMFDVPIVLRPKPIRSTDRLVCVNFPQMVVYLETVMNEGCIYHKVILGDQVGWILNIFGMHFKKTTARMLRRLNNENLNRDTIKTWI